MLRKIIVVLITAYLLLLLYWMFWGFGRSSHRLEEYTYNLIPFHTMKQYLNVNDFNLRASAINLLGNIGVFIPFGLAVPMIVRVSWGRFIAGFIFALFLLELVQMLSLRGTFDVDDVILNTAGAAIGYGICQAGQTKWVRERRQ
ncbi:VanZ family protein [Paenibacillus sp. NFR01]|uniref:VanZ family protein n=1 Tax=Paenibacillus sp. NFR01 TaxID=1566279 RepID=UPI000B8711F8|nr:VanZ family protein [Paenibacillus sp. NFR01]